MNVFIAGFQHETNTFAPSLTEWSAFTEGSGFPPYRRGRQIIDLYRGGSLPIGGFIADAEARGWGLVASSWAGANPAAHITNEAYERIASDIEADLRAALEGGEINAVYLDLHGAAVTVDLDDPEGDLLARVRAAIGPNMPLVASLDLHANVSDRMLDLADALVAYRTYPHVDMADTGRMAARLIERRLAAGKREKLHVKRLDFLLPLNAQCTMIEPASLVYDELRRLDGRHGTVLSFAMAFPAADIVHCRPTVWGYGEEAPQAVDSLFTRIDQPRGQWQLDLMTASDAVTRAMRLAVLADAPVVIADTQDNPGAGADGNTTGMLLALLEACAGTAFPGQVALGLLADPQAAAAAHAAGVGAELELSLGRSVATWGAQFSDAAVQARCTVRSLSDGEVVLKGPMSMGGRVSVGPSACLEVEGVLVAVCSVKTQMLDRELYRFVGIAPERMKLLVNKSSVHFRADFAPIASHILIAKAAGPMAADPSDLPWSHLAPEVALRP
jgi:microcystin degradation protein MlrC